MTVSSGGHRTLDRVHHVAAAQFAINRQIEEGHVSPWVDIDVDCGHRGDLWVRPSVGGKNASLGEMVRNLGRYGIKVPPGFAITADGYWPSCFR